MKNDKFRIRIAVGLSGGVDSAVSAYLLKEEGYDVTGVYLQCWDEKADLPAGRHGGCTAEEDRADAAKVAAHIVIPFKHLNFIKEYKAKVIDYFYKEYEVGRTPNPDVLCNKEIKFGMFLDWAIENNFDYVATGHYARVSARLSSGALEELKTPRLTPDSAQPTELLSGIDLSKDQSYFLYLLNQRQLSKTIFPLGGLKKEKVRKIAKEVGFHNAEKADSVGICFIGEVNIKDFLKKRIKPKKGNVVNKEGEVIGEHEGAWFYTIGQRHGFKITKYHGLPLYVIGKNVKKNELVVGFAKEGNRNGFEVEDIHWINEVPNKKIKCKVRIRHLGEFYNCELEHGGERGVVKLKHKIFGVAPGQSAVFYEGDVVLGGGVIQ